MQLSRSLKITTNQDRVSTLDAQCISYEEWCKEYTDEIIYFKLGELIHLDDVEDLREAVERIEAALCSLWEGEHVYFWIR